MRRNGDPGDDYRLLFDQMDRMVCTLDLQGRFTAVNPAGERLTGYAGDELVGRPATDLIAPELREQAVERFRQRLSGVDDPTPDESVLVTRAGGRVPIEITSSLVVQEGKPVGVLGVVRDISERKSAENALSQSEERFRALLEAAPDGVVIADERGVIVLVNAQTEELFAYGREELVGQRIEILLPEAARELHARHRLGYLSEPRAWQMGAGLELAGRRKDGSTFPVDISLSPLRTSEGVLIVAAVRDVTERKQAEEALRRSEEHFRSAFTFAAIGIALVAPDGRFVEVNDSLCELVGYSADELVAKTFQDITHPDDLEADLEFVRQMLAGEIRTYQMEKRYIHKDGHVVWVLLSVSLVRDVDGHPLHFISQIQDIDARKRAEQKTAQSEARLAEAQLLARLGSWERDFETNEITWSEQLCRIFGVDPSSGRLTYEQFLELVAPQDREAVADVRWHAAETGEPFEDEYRIILPDGEVRWIHSRGRIEVVDGVTVGLVGTAQDVTEHKLVAERLREAESRLRSFFENAPIGQAICDPQGLWLEINPPFSELLGYSAEELGHLTWQDITHPDDVERDAALDARLLAGEFPSYQLEKRYLHKDGSVIWALLTLTLVRDDTGAPLFSIAQVLDISARKRAEEAVAQSEKRLAEAQQLAALGSWEWDVVGDQVTWSDELYRLFDVDPGAGDLTYDKYLRTVHPDDRESLDAVVRRAFETGESFSVEHRVAFEDGSIRWIHGRGEVEQRDGVTVSMRGTAQDVTEHRDAKAKLAEAELRYRTLIEQLPLTTYIRALDMHEPNTFVSPQVEQLLGYPAEAWLTNPDFPATIIHPDDRDRVYAEGDHVRNTGEPLRTEYRYYAQDGRIVWVQDETYIVHDEHGEPQCVQGYVLDITERKQAEEERDRLRDELHHAQKLEALGRLAGGVAHDFNNTLTAIKGYSELLLDGLEPGSSARASAEQITRAAEQAARLPQQLLAFGRKQVLEPSFIDLDDAVEECSDLLRRILRESITLETQPRTSSALVLFDRSQLAQILLNLATNARDAMPDGGTLTITTRREQVSERVAADHEVDPGEFAVVSVRDTGHGMDEQTRARVFEPFFTTKAPGEGSGLGLASTYGTVRQSGGFILVESDPGGGSLFEIHLPCVNAPASSETPAPGEPEAAARTPKTVLVVEDEEMVRDVARIALERAGYRVVDAARADEALDLWAEHGSMDVVVTDMVMPGMSGRELADRVLHVAPTTPIVFMSGYTDEPPVVEVNGTPPSFLQKPFSPSALVVAVGEAVEHAEAQAANGVGNGSGPRITCLVADDHPAVLDSVSRYLQAHGFDVVARVSRGDEALDEIVALRPAIALLDVTMQPLDGIEVAKRAAEVAPETGVVLYTGYRDGALLTRALDAGARGFALKEAPLSQLVEALDTVAGGAPYVDPELAGTVARGGASSTLSPLTRREREVLGLLADGMTNEKVGAELGISPETVQSHVHNAMTKLDADTRTQAVATALRNSLIG